MKTDSILRPLSVSYLHLSSLVNNRRNARTHSRRQIAQISESIKAFGFTNPVLIDRDNTIIAGHGRVAAAKLLGMGSVPTILLEGLTEAQLRAYIIADNRLAEKAGWDNSILAIELQHLLTLDCDLDITVSGFDVPEIDLILQEASQDPDKEDLVNVDAKAKPVSKPGDLWLMGCHRLLCGSSTDETSFKALLGSRRAEAVFTDPPYNVFIDGHASGNGSVQHREFAMASGEMSEAEYVAFLITILVLLTRYSAAGSVHFICIDWRHMGALLTAGKESHETLLNLCVWVKDNGGLGSFYRSRHELVFVFRNGQARHRNNVQLGKYGRNRTNVWEYPCANTQSKVREEGNLLAEHPTVKPVALVADALLDCSARGDLVLDAFVGSGTTLIAAERVGRCCYGIELDPIYVDSAIRRWQRYTGDRAVHAVSGKAFDDLAKVECLNNG